MALITVAGNLEDILGGSAAGAQMFVQLCGYGSRIPRVVGSKLIADTSPLAVTVASGAYSFTVAGNDTIDPSGTYYTVTVRNARNGTVQTNAYSFTGAGPYDLSVATVITYPDGAPVPASASFASLAVVVPYSATPVFNVLSTAVCQFEMTLTGPVTSSTMPVTLPGQLVTFLITQGAGGPWPFAYPTPCQGNMGVANYTNGISTVTFATKSNGLLYPTPSQN